MSFLSGSSIFDILTLSWKIFFQRKTSTHKPSSLEKFVVGIQAKPDIFSRWSFFFFLYSYVCLFKSRYFIGDERCSGTASTKFCLFFFCLSFSFHRKLHWVFPRLRAFICVPDLYLGTTSTTSVYITRMFCDKLCGYYFTATAGFPLPNTNSTRSWERHPSLVATSRRYLLGRCETGSG